MQRVAFICTHNSCRSQVAEAFSRHITYGAYEAFSAGANPAPAIDRGAVLVMKRHFGIDMLEGGQYPKGLEELPDKVDGVVTMGCQDECPVVPSTWLEHWDLPDPTGGSEEEYFTVLEKVREKVIELADRIGGDVDD